MKSYYCHLWGFSNQYKYFPIKIIEFLVIFEELFEGYLVMLPLETISNQQDVLVYITMPPFMS